MLRKNVLPSFFLISFISICFTVVCGSCSDDKEDDPAPSSTISLFYFYKKDNPALSNDILFSINQEDQTIEGTSLFWNESDTPDCYVASFKVPEGYKVWMNGVEQISGQTVNSFLEPLVYEVIDTEGVKTAYTVTFLSPQLHSALPVFRIEPKGEVKDKVNYVKARLEIAGNGFTEGLWDFSKEDIEIRLRGNSTMGLPKRPYRIKFPEKYSPLGLKHTESKSWVLLANDCDKTLLRNAIAFEMSRLLFRNPTVHYDANYTIPYVPSTVHVDVYMNGKYEGVYHFSDQNQQADGRIEVESLKAKDGDNPGKITGGYIMEVDIHAREGEYTTFVSGRDIKMTHKYPDDEDYHSSQYEYIRQHINKGEDALYNNNGEWSQYFDMATAIDFMLVNEFCGDPDAYTSIWMYKRRGCDKIFFGPVWDFDSAFDNDNRIDNAVSRMMLEASFPNKTKDHWFARMAQKSDFKAAVKERWETMKEPLREVAYRILKEEPERMSTSIQANFIRWNIRTQALDTANPGPVNYETGIDQLKEYIDRRYEFLDNEFSRW